MRPPDAKIKTFVPDAPPTNRRVNCPLDMTEGPDLKSATMGYENEPGYMTDYCELHRILPTKPEDAKKFSRPTMRGEAHRHK